jgi:hypothetical protein
MADLFRRGKTINLREDHIDDFRYWDDPRWAEIKRLKGTGESADAIKAREIEEKIKKDWRVS